MRKLLLLSFTFCLLDITVAQHRLVSDNLIMDSLTKFDKSYGIVMHVNGKVSNDVAKIEVRRQLQKYFVFLQNKKYKEKLAEFYLRVSINGKVVGREEQFTSSRTSARSGNMTLTHNILLKHLASGSIELVKGGKNLYSLQLDSNAIIQRSYSYSEYETITDRSWENSSQAAQRRQVEREAAAKGLSGKSELWRFEKDFFYLFDNYKTSKL